MKNNIQYTYPINLDDEQECSEFLAKYGTTKGIRLAHLLGLHGKGSKANANHLSAYAWNKQTAMDCRRRGEIATAMQYEAICDRIYSAMPSNIKW